MKLRITIRDLLWLTLILALAVGWWLDHRRLSAPPFPQEDDPVVFVNVDSVSFKPSDWLREISGIKDSDSRNATEANAPSGEHKK